MKELLIEKEKLIKILKIVKEVLKLEEESLEDLYKSYTGDIDELFRIAAQKKIRINNLTSSQEKPYFARIDFIFSDTGETKSIYIGKNGIIKDNNIYVTDWRAPISSLYYDSDLGKCSYKVPSKDKGNYDETIINGELLLKRQFNIEHGQLMEYFDVDLVANDALLQKYLNENNDTRLKSIVSTIQKDQNTVIRKGLDKNLIIQGVAGSGKTTVALHRIAYLVYNYKDIINQNQYLVIGPNQVFLKYIKSVLPDLDVAGVSQYTFEEFAKDYIGEDFEILSSFQKANDKISGKDENNIDKFKCSLKYKDMISLFMEAYYQSITNNDLKIGDFIVLSKEMISKVFSNTYNENSSSLEIIIEKTAIKLLKIIEENRDSILSRYLDYSSKEFLNAKTIEEKEKLRKKFQKEREEIKNNCLSTIKKYFKKSNLSTLKIYQIFIETIEKFNIYSFDNIAKLKKQTLSNIKKKKYEFEDLAALLYIKYMNFPIREYSRIRHTVIDEAQDFGEFNYYVLKEILKNSTFSIFGDLAQSIYDYRGIDSWEDVNKDIFNGTGEIINFGKSYRTTSEIMTVADDIAEHIGLERSELVVRHGNDVRIAKVDIKDIPTYIARQIEIYKNKGYKTIAIISKTDKISQSLNKYLEIKQIKIPNVDSADDVSSDSFNICTISNQLAKGLEFDAVIINDASEENYNSNNKLDMKLLYVAVTRALHELNILYSGNLTKPLIKKRTLKE